MGVRIARDLHDWSRFGWHLPVLCRRCGRYVWVDPNPLAERSGWASRDPASLRWRCTRCGGRSVWTGPHARHYAGLRDPTETVVPARRTR